MPAGPLPSETIGPADEILIQAGHRPEIVRTLRAGPRPAFGRLRPIKELLTERLGAEAAARAFMQMAGNQPGAVLRLPITSLHEFARTRARRYEELSPGGMVELPPVPVFGDRNRSGFEARTRTVFCCVLDDVVVSSKSNFLLTAGRALLDFQGGEREMVPLDLGVDPIVFAPTDEHVTVAVERGAVEGPVLEEAFALVGVNSFNYWHWHIEFLPRLLACRDLPGFAGVPVLIDAQMPAQSVQALRLFLGPDHPVQVLQSGEAVRVRRLWTCSMFMYLPLWPLPGVSYAPRTMFMDTRAFVARIGMLEPVLGQIEPRSGSKRIYLGRRTSQHRGMTNQLEVEDWFRTHGFELIDPGRFEFAEQLAIVRGAEVIVGPNGAALVNSLFAGAGTSIGVLDNHFIEDNEWYADVCHALGQQLSFLVGEAVNFDPQYEFNADYRIPVERLPAFLDHLLAGTGSWRSRDV